MSLGAKDIQAVDALYEPIEQEKRINEEIMDVHVGSICNPMVQEQKPYESIIRSKIQQNLAKDQIKDQEGTVTTEAMGFQYTQSLKKIRSQKKRVASSQELSIAFELLQTSHQFDQRNCPPERIVQILCKKYIFKLKDDKIFEQSREINLQQYLHQKQELRNIVRKENSREQIMDMVFQRQKRMTQDSKQHLQVISNQVPFKQPKTHHSRVKLVSEPTFGHSQKSSLTKLQSLKLKKENLGSESSRKPREFKEQSSGRRQFGSGLPLSLIKEEPKNIIQAKPSDLEGQVELNLNSFNHNNTKVIPPISLVHPMPLHKIKQASQKQTHYADKYKNEKIIARIFCQYGYGMQIARQFFGDNVDRNLYNNTITTIIRESFRRLEDRIVKERAMKKFAILRRPEFSTVKTDLVHCRKHLPANQLKTFMKFVMLNYQLSDEVPSLEDSVALYELIRRKSKERSVSKKFAKETKESAVWRELNSSDQPRQFYQQY